MENSNRRLFDRLDLTVPAVLRPPDGDMDIPCYPLLTRDISCNGAFFQTLEPLSCDGQVHIELFLKVPTFDNDISHMRLTTTGTVMRRNATGFAVRFEGDYELSTFP